MLIRPTFDRSSDRLADIPGLWFQSRKGGVMPTKIVKNEQRKLAATYFNNIAVGCLLLGLIGPLATGQFAHFLTREFVYAEGAAWVLSAVFHMIARWQLSFLEDER
jgi:hypothetical protein